MINICEYCGKEFAGIAKCCSNSCRHKLARQSGQWDESNRDRHLKEVYICKYCGKDFYPKGYDRVTYCSRECAFGYRKARPKIKEMTYFKCITCGLEFKGRRSKRYCNECKKIRDRLRMFNKNTAKSRHCKQCGTLFVPEYKSSNYTYCSSKCKRKASKENKINREISIYMWNKIMKRDNYICQICGKMLNMDKRGTSHYDAPTIDHIKPVSKGGHNHETNLQAACWYCNCILKRNKENVS
jgi:predicted nucleic acid-binding Zn ribbon protein